MNGQWCEGFEPIERKLISVLISGSLQLHIGTFWSITSSDILEPFISFSINLSKGAAHIFIPVYFIALHSTRQVHMSDMNYYAWKMWASRSQCFSPQMNNRHPWQLKISKSWGPFWSYQLYSTANVAYLAHFLGKWERLAILFSW